MSSDYMIYMMLGGIMSFIGMLVQNRLKSKFQKYSQVPLRKGWTGEQVAYEMLQHYGVTNVRIVQGQGMLTDHYNPSSKTVSLSPAIHQGRTVMAAAVAAHEVGHAIQHDTQYSMLQMRSKVVPLVQIASNAQQWLLMGAFMLAQQFPALLLITIISFMVTTGFALLTLPVEFDASNRALAWLEAENITSGEEHEGAKDALKWAAMTYVVSALTSLVMLIFLILRYVGRR